MAWFMWHAAALFRWSGKQKFPDLSAFMAKRGDEKKKPVDGPNEDAIMAWLVASKAKQQQKAKK